MFLVRGYNQAQTPLSYSRNREATLHKYHSPLEKSEAYALIYRRLTLSDMILGFQTKKQEKEPNQLSHSTALSLIRSYPKSNLPASELLKGNAEASATANAAAKRLFRQYKRFYFSLILSILFSFNHDSWIF